MTDFTNPNAILSEEILNDIKCPVLILWGDKDRIIPFSGLKTFSQWIPNSQAYPLENCGHAVLLDSFEETTNEVLRFINSYHSTSSLNQEDDVRSPLVP